MTIGGTMIQLLILNLLSTRNMSVYDIKSELKKVDALRWANILIGSIQHAVLTLEKKGAVEIINIETTGKRSKTIYKITEIGEHLMKEKAIESLTKIELGFPYNFYIGLSNLNTLNRHHVLEILNVRKNNLLLEKNAIMNGISLKRNITTLDKTQESVIQNMMELLSSQLILLDKIICELGECK